MTCSDAMMKKSLVGAEGFNVMQQVSIAALVCALSSLSFLPFLLGMELHDARPEEAYAGAADDVIIDLVNAVMVSCMCIMLLEALLDSNTLYLPIKIAFPRFVMVFGLLVTSLTLYGQELAGEERLNFLVCSHYARIYLICSGIFVSLIRHSARDESEQLTYQLGALYYLAAVLTKQWCAYYERNEVITILQHCVTVATLLLGLHFIVRAVQLFAAHDRALDTRRAEQNHYDLICHVIICIFVFALNIINSCFGFQSWKDTSAKEIAAYSLVGLFATVLFFFTSSYIAQRHFVMTESQLINKKSFVRYVSHEIRTPLNTVYLGIQLLSSELQQMIAERKSEGGVGGSDCGAARLLVIVGDISASCGISLNILNDLLLIDKIEEGNLKLVMKPALAEDIFEHCIRSFDVQALYSNIRLAVDLQALRNVTIDVDETKLVQVVRNIVSNALKFTPSGGKIQVQSRFIPDSDSAVADAGPVTTKMSGCRIHAADPAAAAVTRGKIRVEFLDTGPGMTEANKAELFESVVQFNPNVLQSGGGSGLGLFISNAIMKRHAGGVIGVLPGGVAAAGEGGEAGAGQLVASETASSGCAFFIELSAHVAAVSGGESHRDTSCISDGMDSFHSYISDRFDMNKVDRVLVVEDSKLNRKMMAKVLSSYANEVVLAHDGIEAVTAVRECMQAQDPLFDVIFMDSLMPNMNGIDATKIILRELKFPNPIIAVTGSLLPEDVREFEDAGVLAVLSKPLQLDKLDDVLRGITSNSFEIRLPQF